MKNTILCSLLKHLGRRFLASLAAAICVVVRHMREPHLFTSQKRLLWAGAFLFVPMSVWAQPYVSIVVSGTVHSGTDISGVFGPPNTDLAGQPFTVSFVFNSSLGTQSDNGGDCIKTTCESDISGSGAQSPGIAYLTIGSSAPYLFSVNGNPQGSSYSQRTVTPDAPFPSTYFETAEVNTPFGSVEVILQRTVNHPLTIPGGWSTPFSDSGADNTSGSFGIASTGQSASGLLSPESIVVSAEVTPPLQVTTTSLPTASSGLPYSTALAATGGSGTGYSWSISAGTLPTGFVLSPGGVLTSTGSPPAAAQSYTFTVKVTDSASDTATKQFTLVVSPEPCAITSETLATVPGVPNSRTRVGVGEIVALTSNTPVTWAIASGCGTLSSSSNSIGVPSSTCSGNTSAAIYGAEAWFYAPYSNATTVITAAPSNGTSCSIPFTTVQPTGLIFQRLIAPPLQAPGYGFQTFSLLPNLLYGMEMYSVAFVTPGDVSFAKIGVAELDDPSPHTTGVSNVLVPVGGINAWLLSCDHDLNTTVFPPPSGPITWQYTYGSTTYATAQKAPFAKTQTTLSHAAGQSYVYQKGQVQALSSTGATWVSTPNAPSALLQVPWGSPNSTLLPSPLGPTPLAAYQACIALVEYLFGVVQ